MIITDSATTICYLGVTVCQVTHCQYHCMQVWLCWGKLVLQLTNKPVITEPAEPDNYSLFQTRHSNDARITIWYGTHMQCSQWQYDENFNRLGQTKYFWFHYEASCFTMLETVRKLFEIDMRSSNQGPSLNYLVEAWWKINSWLINEGIAWRWPCSRQFFPVSSSKWWDFVQLLVFPFQLLRMPHQLWCRHDADCKIILSQSFLALNDIKYIDVEQTPWAPFTNKNYL